MARGKNEVTLTFAGDSDQLDKAVKRAESSTKGLADAFDMVDAAAKRADASTAGISMSSDRLSRFVGKGGADLRAYRSDLDGVGDGFNDIEDRTMGVGNLINGFSDVMKGGSEGAATFAMGLSDMAAGVRYAVVPTLQDATKGIKNFVGSLGGMKSLLVGGGVAVGIGALAFGLKQLDEQQAAKRMEEFNDQLEDTGRLANDLAEEMLFAAASSGNLDKLLQHIGDTSGFAAAERFVEQAQALGADEEAMRQLNAELAELRDEQSSAADALDALTEALNAQQDAIRAQVDPLFAVLSATQSLAGAKADEVEATNALNEAIAAGDPAAIAAAERDLADAHLGVNEAALTLTDAERQLSVMLSTGQITVEEMNSILGDLEASGYTSGDAARYLRDRINEIQSKHVTVTADTQTALTRISDLYTTLSRLPENKTITLGFSSHGIAELNRFRALAGGYAGGIVPDYLAAGGMTGSFGPRGTDTVPAWLTPGEMVLNAGQQANLFRALDSGGVGGGRVNVYVQGSILSERELVKVVTDAQRRGGGVAA